MKKILMLSLSLIGILVATTPTVADEVAVDSYNGYGQYDNLHPLFLSRLAYTGATDENWGEEDGQPGTSNDLGRKKEMEDHNSAFFNTPNLPQGTFSATPNASDLQGLFDRVARRIKLRLIS